MANAYSRTDVVKAIETNIALTNAKIRDTRSSSQRAMLEIDLLELEQELNEIMGE